MDEQNVKSHNSGQILPNRSDHKVKFWDGIGIALAVLAGQFIAVILAVIVALVLGYREPESMTNILMAIGLPLGFLLAVWIVLRKRKLAATAWSWDRKYWVLMPVSILLMYSVSYLIGGILENMPGYDEMLNQYVDLFEGIHPAILIFAGAFIGPVCEEIIFRGIILKEFLKTYNPQKAIIFSSIIFGVIHLIPLQAISAFFIGIVLAYVYYKTRSLWLPIIMHVLNNLIAFIFGVETEVSTTKEWFDSETLYLLSFVLSALLAFGLYKAFENIHGSKKEIIV